MKFSYSVIGYNTQENREWLEKVGYESLRFFQGNKYLYATTCQRANAKEVWDEPYYGTVDDVDFYVSCGFIPTFDNYPLFKAVSAMREDSDYGQLFECKDGLFVCQYETSREHIDKECKGWDMTSLKKFNLAELQERFKK